MSAILKACQKRSITIFVDALDEAGEDPARDMIRVFKAILESLEDTEGILRICFSCRKYPILDTGFDLSIPMEETNENDISLVVNRKLQGMGSPDLGYGEDLASVIVKNSKGVFQ